MQISVVKKHELGLNESRLKLCKQLQEIKRFINLTIKFVKVQLET